ncbi:MAG: YgiQ family radical SAM protein [Oscillospiraceae bacterium]
MSNIMIDFLPINREDMLKRGWEQVDFVYVSGDSYVDHPSFGMAIITRLLESQGFKIGVLAQPNTNNLKEFESFSKPKYGFLVSSGNVDSMVNHYSVAKIRRDTDFFTAGGEMGKRPDYAVKEYCKAIRAVYPDTNIIIGGVEASLRRFAHYDYWSDSVFPSILIETKADLLSYGMGENSITEICERLKKGETLRNIKDVRGTCYIEEDVNLILKDSMVCSSYNKVKENKLSYAKASKIQLINQDYAYGKTVVQKHGDVLVVQNPPSKPLSEAEMDEVYNREYTRTYHPCYKDKGGVPSIEEVKFSIIQNRGCFGSCNFCAITLHQGKYVTSRSKDSILKEAVKITKQEDFKGNIHDVGGPTANFRKPSCDGQLERGICPIKKCLAPKKCKHLKIDHSEYLDILRSLRKVDGVKNVFVRSGIRFDYVLYGKDDKFLKEVVKNHTSGQLKVAPEHICDNVLGYMGKPGNNLYQNFSDKFYEYTKSMGKKQYLVPYLMSSHPGSTMKDAIELSIFLNKNKIKPEQVQDFYPTPGTVSTTMYYTGLDPMTLDEVYVPKTREEKKTQRAFLQYYKESNSKIIRDALIKNNRKDLIGFESSCLVKPQKDNKSIKKDIVVNYSGVELWQNQKGVKRRSNPKGRK